MDTILHFLSRPTAAASEKLAGAQDVASRHGCHVQVVENAPTVALVRQLATLWHPVGAIVDCGGEWSELDARVFGRLPAVMLGHAPGGLPAGVLSVRHDAGETGRAAARELLATGRRHFAYVPYFRPLHWSVARGLAFAGTVRLHGFECVAMKAGSAAGAAWQRALRAFLRGLAAPCALFAANDAVASEVLAAARFEGIAVPDALAVLGVDNNEALCERSVPSLSSIEPDFRRGGALAARLLLEAVSAGGGVPASRRELTFGELRVVRRASTRPLATPDRSVAEALALIRREACSGLRPAQVAALFPCSRRMADLRFRRAVGHSIGEEIAAARLEETKRLLADPMRQIKAIGDFCGFGAPGALRKFFRRDTGMSLSAWRRTRAGGAP